MKLIQKMEVLYKPFRLWHMTYQRFLQSLSNRSGLLRLGGIFSIQLGKSV